MAAIKLTAFSGEQPRMHARLLPENAAQSAVNVRLDDGGLTPVRMPVQIAEAASATHQTIYRYGEEWLSWTGVVHAAPGPVASERLYYTGDGPPKMRIAEDVYALALPRPETAVTATLFGSGSGDVSARTYVYTWVTTFGEESEPCPASELIDWQPGNTVELTGFEPIPTGRSIAYQRIYRSQTGRAGTYYYLIAERSAATTVFTDNIAADAFQEPLPSASWNAPLETLSGLVVLPSGIMAAFSGNDLYFSEPYRPHAWPEAYSQTTDFPIVGLGAIGSALVVLTTGHPYILSGSTPESMQMRKLELNLPCINARAIVDLGFAIAYPTNEGLVAVRGDGSCAIVSSNLFDRDDWLALSPSTFVAGQFGGRYVAFYDTLTPAGDVLAGSMIIDISGTPFLSRSTDRASATFFDVASGALFYLKAGTTHIYRLDPPGTPRAQMYWRSKEFFLPTPENFGAIIVDADDVLTGNEEIYQADVQAALIAQNAVLIAAGPIEGELDGAAINAYALGGDLLNDIPDFSRLLSVGVIADGERVAQISRTNRVVRLPSGYRARKWEIDVNGIIIVTQIVLGKTVADLQATP